MKFPPVPHRWSVTPKQAVAIQTRLASKVSTRPARVRFKRVAGADLAFSADGRRCIAGIVVWDIAARTVVETCAATRPVTFPYVPGLLTFREGPALLAAIRRLRSTPDAFLFDGQGLAHPRRFGLACHMGVLINKPSLGCGKSLLIGRHKTPGRLRGSTASLLHDDVEIGCVVRTRTAVKPVYVSVGHRMNLAQAVDLVLTCGNGFRLPEPTRLADQLVARTKRQSP